MCQGPIQGYMNTILENDYCLKQFSNEAKFSFSPIISLLTKYPQLRGRFYHASGLVQRVCR